jgi:hypothetical protein
MKKFVSTLVVMVLAACLPASPLELTITDLGAGNLQIIASGPPGEFSHGVVCVLQSTTDFVNWTVINTKLYPIDGLITNIVQTTNSMTFYRVYIPNP